MKPRFVLIFLIIVMQSSHVFGQQSQLSVGFLAGPSLSFLIPDSKEAYLAQIGASAGINIEYKLKDKLMLRSGLLVARKSFSLNPNYEISPLKDLMLYKDIGQRLDYIKIPFMMQNSTGEHLKFTLSSGFYVAYLARAESWIERLDGEIYNRGQSKEGLKKMDFGVLMSYGLRLPVNDKWNITSEFMANFGLNRVLSKAIKYYTINSLVMFWGVNYTL